MKTGPMHTRFLAPVLAAACGSAPLLFAACSDPTPELKPDPAATQKPKDTGGATSAKPRPTPTMPRPEPPKPKPAKAQPVATVEVSPDDPVKGKWTLEDATKGLPAGDTILATIETEMGNLECRMYADKAPITVANFVGLARGIRPWKTPAGKWEKKAAYDDGVFHRIIKGFMIQGGDPQKNGSGEPGYVIPDEVWEGATHDRPGLICMANRGANTNGAQFFITDEAAPNLDFDETKPPSRRNAYTIFGECGPVDLIHKLASVKTRGDRPVEPPAIKKVTITRKNMPATAPSTSASAGASAAPTASASAGPSAIPSSTATAAPTK